MRRPFRVIELVVLALAVAILIGVVMASWAMPVGWRPQGGSGAESAPGHSGRTSPTGVRAIGGRRPMAAPPATPSASPVAPRPTAQGASGVPFQPPVDAALADLRRRVAEAQALHAASQVGGAEGGRELGRRLAAEADPRVRHALAHGVAPDLPRPRPGGVKLPAAAAATPAGPIAVYWQAADGLYQSRIEVAADGRARVETIFEPAEGPAWTVRYPAWSWRAADGRTVIDARDQEVELVHVPEGSWWSPDSVVIGGDGRVELIDDVLAPGTGTTGSSTDG